MVYGIAAALVGSHVAAIEANDTVVPTIWNIEIIGVWWTNNGDRRRNVHRKNRRIDSCKARGGNWEPTIVIVLSRIEARIQHFRYGIDKWAAKRDIHWFICADANFEVSDILIHHNIEVATIVIGK